MPPLVEKDGIVFIDKPYGITSHYAAELVKKILNVKKAGHTGTLDPKATGLLIVLINKATRLAWIFNLDKIYVGVGRLHKDVSLSKLREAKKRFIGKIIQIPPKRSSVKREARQREVYYFKILEKKGKDFLFKVKCQAGTYIRKLIHDLGEMLEGANMLELRRVAIGKFKEELSLSLYDVEKLGEKAIINVEKALAYLDYPKININHELSKRFCNGNFISIQNMAKNEQKKLFKYQGVVLVFHKKKFLGVGIKANEKIKPKTVIRQL